MVTMNLGSVSNIVYNMIANVPTNVSGTVLFNIIDQQRVFMENYTGQSIGSTAIAEKYQPALIDLSCGELGKTIGFAGGIINSTTIGELSVSKSITSNEQMVNQYRDSGMEKLKLLGKKLAFKKVWGV